MRVWFTLLALFAATQGRADVSVRASVDRNRVALGEAVTLTITVQGVQGGAQPVIPPVDGLAFAGPATQTSFSIVNGQTSQSLSFTYQVAPTRTGEFVIPAIQVNVGGKGYSTEPIKLAVEKGAPQADLSQQLFARVRLNSQQVYLGQTAALDVLIFSRADVPLKGFGGFNYNADGLGYKYLQNLKSGTQVIDGVQYNVHLIEGAISPTQAGPLAFGPTIVRAQLATQRRRRNTPFDDSLFDQFFGNVELREVPLTIDPVSIEVLPLPAEGRPADFAGAIGQWNLEVTAQPTEVAVGDPITLTIKVTGTGNIDTVPAPKLTGLDNFKTYDPTSKTQKNELNTTGERVYQQVLIAKDTNAQTLPEVRLPYFDPIAKAYKTAVQAPIKLLVKAGSSGQTAIVSGGLRLRPQEKLGQDIVYLKGDLGPVVAAPFCGTPLFWTLNLAPVAVLLGGIFWKRREDKLTADVAYARRSRAARRARKLLASAIHYDEIQRALQSYLGDQLNIPASGITASIVDEQLLPRGVNPGMADEVRKCFETCDAARFAGVGGDDVSSMRQTVERVIDELETTKL